MLAAWRQIEKGSSAAAGLDGPAFDDAPEERIRDVWARADTHDGDEGGQVVEPCH